MIVDANPEPEQSCENSRYDSSVPKLSPKQLNEEDEMDTEKLPSQIGLGAEAFHNNEGHMQRSSRSLPARRPVLTAKNFAHNRSELLTSGKDHVEMSSRTSRQESSERQQQSNDLNHLQKDTTNVRPVRSRSSSRSKKGRRKSQCSERQSSYPSISTKDSGIMKMRSCESEDETARIYRREKELSKQLMDDILIIARLEEQERLFGSHNTKADKKRSMLIKSLVVRVEATMKETSRLKKILRQARRSDTTSSSGARSRHSKLAKLYSDVMSCNISQCSPVKGI
jgi:hypothetical protein